MSPGRRSACLQSLGLSFVVVSSGRARGRSFFLPEPLPPTITAFAAFAAFAADDADVDADAPSPSLLPISPPCRRRPPARLAVMPAATRPSCGLCACARVARCAPRTPCVQSSVRPTVRLPVGIHTVPCASRTRVSPMCLVSCVQYVCGLLARGRCVRAQGVSV